MTREDFIKQRIKQSGHDIKSFAKSIDIPYSTLRSMLKSDFVGAAVDKVYRVCKGLNITVEDLMQFNNISFITDIKNSPLYGSYENKTVETAVKIGDIQLTQEEFDKLSKIVENIKSERNK